jgi:hypothetical protein
MEGVGPHWMCSSQLGYQYSSTCSFTLGRGAVDTGSGRYLPHSNSLGWYKVPSTKMWVAAQILESLHSTKVFFFFFFFPPTLALFYRQALDAPGSVSSATEGRLLGLAYLPLQAGLL